jgi:Exonuclease VII, large subunit
MNSITLFDLQQKIKKCIDSGINETPWVTAEISDITNNVSGHCYLDLVDYKDGEVGVIAKARGIIWGNTYRIIKPFFETTTGESLKQGMRILIKVQVTYSTVYGLALTVLDIDPSFTVGELELKRQQIIKRLQDEGCMEMNKLLKLPTLPKKLAVISSSTAAGYRDFMNHLTQNEYGFKFKTTLFKAIMQGDEAPDSIISALDKIAAEYENYDAVVIIRGGGATMDMACFDDYNLSVNIAQFPLPVITGIGHDKDFHIADMVAHTWLKTPTAVANFFVDIFVEQEQYLVYFFQRISLSLTRKVALEKEKIYALKSAIRLAVEKKLLEKNKELELFVLKIKAADVANILEKGFAMVAVNGERGELSNIKEGERVKLIFKDGNVEFEVGKILSKKEN